MPLVTSSGLSSRVDSVSLHLTANPKVPMKPHPRSRTAVGLTLLLALSACGGGGGPDSPSEPATFPTSGPYGWVLKAAGPTDALKFGLSLVHRSTPSTEFVIEAASAVVTDARLVSSGTIVASDLKAISIQPHTLVYIVGGDVRSIAMQADGTAPLTHRRRAQSTSACRFLIDAIDHAAALESRFIVSTAGDDGRCGTTDDRRAEVRISSSDGNPTLNPVNDVPLDVVRDPTTLAPRGWIYPRTVALWADPAGTLQTRPSPAAAVARVVASTFNAALVEDGSRLSVIGFPGGSSFIETSLDGAITAGSNWKSIGFDANNFYLFKDDPGNGFSSPWAVVKVTRVNPTATVLASGTGLLTLGSMGRNVLYLTVFTSTDNRLVRIDKFTGAQSEEKTVITTSTTVQTGANGVHQLWKVTGIGGPAPTYRIDIADENGAILTSFAGGFPLAVADAASVNFNASESRSRFIFASDYGPRAYGDASLMAYDTDSRSSTLLGRLPGTAEYGSDFVYASAIGGPMNSGVGYAARSRNGSVVESGSKVFSFELGIQNSLSYTTIAN